MSPVHTSRIPLKRTAFAANFLEVPEMQDFSFSKQVVSTIDPNTIRIGHSTKDTDSIKDKRGGHFRKLHQVKENKEYK